MQLQHLDDERRANERLGFPQAVRGPAGKGRERLGDELQVVNNGWARESCSKRNGRFNASHYFII